MMCGRKKIVVAVVLILLLGAGLFFLNELRWRAAQKRRDTEYGKVLSIYRHDLRPGMTRGEVANYLQSRQVRYSPIYWGGDGVAYATKIGQDPSREWYCEYWTVDIGLEFNSTSKERPEMEPLQTDTLREIRIRKFGTCL